MSGNAAVRYLIARGRLRADSKPDEYYGSVEHQKDLVTRLGLDPEAIDTGNEQDMNRLFTVLVQAQISGKDKSGELLEVSDMWLLSRLTGYE